MSLHPVHVTALAALQDVPAMQAVHDADPAAAAVPGAHSWQLEMDDDPAANPLVPAGQLSHATDPTGDTENIPAGQNSHVSAVRAPSLNENVPAGQSEHVVAADVPDLNLPAGHCEQKPLVTADGTVDRNWPAGQFMTVCARGGPLPAGQ